MMNAFIALVLGASVLASAFGDPRVMIESTYTDTKGLNDLAKSAWQNRGGKYMGTATGIKQLSDPYYIQKLNGTSDFGMITPVNAMKWDATEPKQGVFTFEDADKIVAFANSTGARVRCHALVWVSLKRALGRVLIFDTFVLINSTSKFQSGYKFFKKLSCWKRCPTTSPRS